MEERQEERGSVKAFRGMEIHNKTLNWVKTKGERDMGGERKETQEEETEGNKK